MLPEFGTDEFAKYLKNLEGSKPIRHKFYKQTVEEAEEMAVHTLGEKPKKILERKRPNEDTEVREYRLNSWEPITTSLVKKVISVINRIYNPRLYNISFKEPPQKVPEEKHLENYLKNIPVYGSFMKFIQDVYTKQALTDPNSVILIDPLTYDLTDNEFFEPIPRIYSSKSLLDFKEGEYYTILQDEKSLCIVDREWIRYFIREKKTSDWELDNEYPHNFGRPCAFRIGGAVKEAEDPLLYHSYISGVKPHWNKVISMTSDMDGSIINHLYLEKWEYAEDDCGVCEGTGLKEVEIDNSPIDVSGSKKKIEVKCTTCGGVGKIVKRSPFGVHVINRDAIERDQLPPNPPFGYPPKEISPLQLLRDIVKEEAQAGLSAINMDILFKVGENQSGIAKTIDRQDLDSFLTQISNHTFKRIIPGIITAIARWMYKKVLSPREIEEQIPDIEEPATFDILSVNNLLEELQNIKSAGLSGAIVNGLQKDIIEKRFNSEKQKKKLKAILDLDPLSGLSNDDIMTGTSLGTISRVELYIHQHITHLINTIITEQENFLDIDFVEKQEILFEKAKTILAPVETIPIKNEPE